jgi:hypothetical protein
LTDAPTGATLVLMSWRGLIGCASLALALGCSNSDSLGRAGLTVGDGGVVALIVESASSNAAEADVTVYSDGSANRTIGSPRGSFSVSPAMFPAGSPEVVVFLADLTAVGNVSTIQIGQCGKSVSFGTTTTVTANGSTSGDLQCLKNPTAAAAALAMDCAVLDGDDPQPQD